MAEDQEKAIARERMDEKIAIFVVGPVTLIVAFRSILFFLGGPPITVWEKWLCWTVGVITAIAAANGYFKVMQGRYLFTKKGDLKRFFAREDDTRDWNNLNEFYKSNRITVWTIIIYCSSMLLYFLFRSGGWLGF